MKFSITALTFIASSVLAGKGPKDTNKPPTVTVYATETTHKYGRFNKTPHPTTTTSIISPSEYSELAGKSASSILARRDDYIVKRANDTAGGAAAGNGTAGGAGGAGNGTAGGAAGGNGTSGGSSTQNAGNVAASGATFAVAGAIAAGVALLV
ncbi:uncharacterized protein KGF55_002198 [Candida pseudojiufengensis]|uniref:uncharacterized protein n=1 Tax=Candida pseudojiufengensis TaxID=497109 RepID=UPI002225160C|nr:uncharacterized protein KGF55_002198 [Candida pseudojiufengensis]KAI5964256.1 hypothetical protein KGF55_002198 [Candida pseudojiufengensis]